jgi:hypothetical protein
MGGRGQELGAEKTYIGALLHDIGKLALHVLLGEDYLSLVNQAPMDPVCSSSWRRGFWDATTPRSANGWLRNGTSPRT